MRVALFAALSLLYGVTAVVGRAVHVVRPFHGTADRNNALTARHNNLGLEVCAALNTILVVGDVAFGQVSACLCLSTAGSYVKSSLNTTTVARASPKAVETRLQSLIRTAPNHRTCNYPDKALPLCTRSNPCSWSCPSGLQQTQTGCHPLLPPPRPRPSTLPAPVPCPNCPKPPVILTAPCPGCGGPPKPPVLPPPPAPCSNCPSQPQPPTKPPCSNCGPSHRAGPLCSGCTPDPSTPPPCSYCNPPKPPTSPPCSSCNPPNPPPPCPSSHSKRTTDLQAESKLRLAVAASCLAPRLGCAAQHGWDCLDVASNLYSCGGCVHPLFNDQPVGADCSAIEGADVVECRGGRCIVSKCRESEGWAVHHNRGSCVKIRSKTNTGVRNVAFWRRAPSLAIDSSVATALSTEGLVESYAAGSADASIYRPRVQSSWKRDDIAVDSATYAAAELIANILGSHADLLTETFVGSNAVLNTRVQEEKRKREPVLVDTAADLASATKAKLGDTLLLADTFADTSALGILNLRGQADWKRSPDLAVDSVTASSIASELGPNHASPYKSTFVDTETETFSDTRLYSGTTLDGTELYSDSFISSSVNSALQTRDLLGAVDETAVTTLLGSTLVSTAHLDTLLGRELETDVVSSTEASNELVSSTNAAGDTRVIADAQLESTTSFDASLRTDASVELESADELATGAAVVAGSYV